MTALLPIRRGGHVIVNDDIAQALEPLLAMGWWIYRPNQGTHRPYLVSTSRKTPRSRWPEQAPLARIVLGAIPKTLFPRHSNGNVLDCRRENLTLTVSRGEAGTPLSG